MRKMKRIIVHGVSAILFLFGKVIDVNSSDFPVGCPLNTISNEVLRMKNSNLSECGCKGNSEDDSSLDCLSKLDELHDKIRQQDYELISEMVKGLSVELINKVSPSSGETALLIATKQSGYVSYMISMKLVEYGADVNKRNIDGTSPLINAIQASNLPLVALLLLNGADIEGSDNNDVSPLFHSVMTNDIKMAHFLLKCGSSPNSMDRKGITPLYYLLKSPMTSLTEEFFELLLDYGSSVTDVTLDGRDSVSFLINSGNKHLLEKLIEHPNFARYVVRNNMQEEYLSSNERFSHNSTLSELNKSFSNAKDKILRIINAIKMGFGRKALFSLIIPEVGNRNKDICLVKDEEGRTLIWWVTHYGDDELTRLLVNFYKVQSRSGVLEFEFCDLNEPDVYGNLPVGHVIYSFDTKHKTPDSEQKAGGEDSPEKSITEEETERIENGRFSIIQDMLLFQNPRTNATLWYELVMSPNGEAAGEQKIVEYLSSSIIRFPVLSFMVRCFCVPLERSSIQTPRSVPEIGTYEYDSVISILSLLLLLNKNHTSKIVLQSILRESMLQSFWCIQALQHALITATILGRDDMIRSILLGRVQTLSEVLSKLDYSSNTSIKVASRLLGSIPPEFPNLDDLMLIPVTLLVRHIILTTKNCAGGCRYACDDADSEETVFGESDLEQQQWEGGHSYSSERSDLTEYAIDNTGWTSIFDNNTLVEEEEGNGSKRRNTQAKRKTTQRNDIEDTKYFKEEMRSGYFHESDTFSHLEISTKYDSLLSNFEYIFSKSSRLSNLGRFEAKGTSEKEGCCNRCREERKTRETSSDQEKSLSSSFGLLKQFLSAEMTKFVRPSSFEQIISLLQNSTCNYPRGLETENSVSAGKDRHREELLGEDGRVYRRNEDHISHFDHKANEHAKNDKYIADTIKELIEDEEGIASSDRMGNGGRGGIGRIEAKYGRREGVGRERREDNINKIHIFDLFYKNDMIKETNIRTGNCLIELPSICDLLINHDIIWVPLIAKDQVYNKIDPTGTLVLDSQKANMHSEIGDKNVLLESWSITSLSEEYQMIHLNLLPKTPSEVNIWSLGQIVNSSQFYNIVKRNGNCEGSTSYTTFDELLAKKARIITLLNSSKHYEIIPTITRTSAYIILTMLFYFVLWSFVSYLKSLYINNMINEWSKKRIRKRDRIQKSRSTRRKDGACENMKETLCLRTGDLSLTRSTTVLDWKKRNKKRRNRKNKRKGAENRKSSFSFFYSFTVSVSKYIRNVLLNLLPRSLFKLKDYADIFPHSREQSKSDSLLLSLSLIFTSPWYVYEKKESYFGENNGNFVNNISKSVLLNAPLDYFVGTKLSMGNEVVKTLLKYLFFFVQVTSLVYLFIILLFICEYEYICFLVGMIIVSSFCTSIRIYYSHGFASNYCNKYFCGYSKDYYLYNYYYFKKNVKRSRNIRNIYSKLIGYSSYNHGVSENQNLDKVVPLPGDDGLVDKRNSNHSGGYALLERSVTFPIKEDEGFGVLNERNSEKQETFSGLKSHQSEYEQPIYNDATNIGDVIDEMDVFADNSNNFFLNYRNDGISSSNLTQVDSITSPFCTSPSFSSITPNNTQIDASFISSTNQCTKTLKDTLNSDGNSSNDRNNNSETNVSESKRNLSEKSEKGLNKLRIRMNSKIGGLSHSSLSLINQYTFQQTEHGREEDLSILRSGVMGDNKRRLSPIISSSHSLSSVSFKKRRQCHQSLKKHHSLEAPAIYDFNSPLNQNLGRISGSDSTSPAQKLSLSSSSSSSSFHSSSPGSVSSPEEYRRLERRAVNYSQNNKNDYNSNCQSSTLLQSTSSYNDYLQRMIFGERKQSQESRDRRKEGLRNQINRVLMRIRSNTRSRAINKKLRQKNIYNEFGNLTDIKVNYKINRTNNCNNDRLNKNSEGTIKLKRFKKLLSSEEERLSCDNIKTNMGNLITNNKIYKPLYKLVDEVSYNSPFEYFVIVSICKLVSGLIAMSSNICILVLRTNSYLFRDSMLYFLYNKSPFTLYLVECIFIYWLSNLIFELLKGLIVLLFFVRQRKRLCIVLVEHIPIQFKYSNVQEFIQIVSYWRSAIQHILYKNTKLWTTFIDTFISTSSLVLFCIGKLIFIIICKKKSKIFNSKLFDFYVSDNGIKGDSEKKGLMNDIFGSGSGENTIIQTESSKSSGGGGSDVNLYGGLYRMNGFPTSSLHSHYHHHDHSPLSCRFSGDRRAKREFDFATASQDGLHLCESAGFDSFCEEGVCTSRSSFKPSGLREEEADILGFDYYGKGDPFENGFMGETARSAYYNYFSSTRNILFSSMKLPAASLLTSFIATKQYIQGSDGIGGVIRTEGFRSITTLTNEKTRLEFPNRYSNCEIVFLTLCVFILVFTSFIIRLLYQVNRSSARTHSWLENIIHRTPPGAGIYIVIEKVLLVINSTPPTIKICGFSVNERFSGFNMYIFTPVLILLFIKFILF